MADSTVMVAASRRLVLSALLAAGSVALSPMSSPVAHAAEVSSSAYQPISPIRVADTRSGVGVGRFSGGESKHLSVVTPAVRAAAGLRAGDVVSAVVLNVTIVDAAGPGFVTVWPQGGNRPNTSSVNSDYGGHTVANTVTTPVSSSGAVSLYSIGGSHIIVDVQGVFVSARSATGGRLVSLSPARALDTRPTGNPFGARQTRVVDLRPYGVPASASAAVLNITLVQAAGPGFLTVWPGGPMPDASNLNANTGDVVANQVMVGMSDGRFSIYAFAGGHVIVDVAGYFTGNSAAASSDGLFVPVTPGRLFDTRSPSSLTGGAKMGDGSVATLTPSQMPGLPATGVGAVALNLTLAHTAGPGFATVWPSGAIPDVSSVNAHRAEQVVANHVVASLSPGSFNVFTHMGSHVIADVFGYWTSAGAGGTDSTPVTNPPVTDTTPVTNPPGGGTDTSSPSTGPHAFLFPIPEGRYARWNPCRALDYQLNAGSASPAQLAALAQAITEVEAATGIDFVQVGTTSGGLEGRPPAGARAVVVLTTPDKAPILGGAAGLGGGSYYLSGEVTEGYTLVSTNITSTNIFKAVVLHELGHMVGLAHVPDNTQIMNPVVTNIYAYGNGDREGLWRVGAAQGCVGSGRVEMSVAAADVPEEMYTVTCGQSMHPVYAGVEVIASGSPGHDDNSAADDGGTAPEHDERPAGEVCVRVPVASR